jgi:HAD superfamily hydrolase (TIGR01509 family)
VARTAIGPRGLKVVVFDVDGTLYEQGPLRRAMLLRLLGSHLLRPLQGWRTIRVLSAYRHAQESLRVETAGDVGAAQIAMAAERTGCDPAEVATCVERWMEREPLPLLRRFRSAGLEDFLRACKAQGLRLAVLSDYPATAKLEALGIADYFDLVLCAQSPDIGVFKPHPRGLLVALQRLGVAPHECLYVGDRAEVDAVAADAAGIPSVIVTRAAGRTPDARDEGTVPGYPQLQALLFGGIAGSERQELHRVA